MRISLERIEEARSVIDPVFLDTPQFRVERFDEPLGLELVFKIECLNPIRSFKGRGAEYFTHRHREITPHPWVCASAGNFGQGLAYAAAKHDIPLVVFAAETANPFKLQRMRELGAELRIVGRDFDAAKEASRAFAEAEGLTFVEDGREPEITEGAGTMAIELLREQQEAPLDAILLPLGNGALANGVGTWVKARAPGVRVIGVGARNAPAMERSFRERRPVALDAPVETIADGVATRVAVPEAVETLVDVLDDVLLVEETDIVQAMESIARELGLLVEGAGAITLAAARVHRERFRGRRLALVVSGSNRMGGS